MAFALQAFAYSHSVCHQLSLSWEVPVVLIQLIPRRREDTQEDPYSSQEANGPTEMLYTLSRLAPGSYDVLLDGVIIASLVRSGETNRATWTAELLMDVHPRRRPAPFTATEHTFGSLEEAQKWLGGAELQDTETQG